MADRLLTLDQWAARHYATPPCMTTLRAWCKNGLIQPQPVKHGRAYYVQPEAAYTDPSVGRLRGRAYGQDKKRA